MGERRRTAKGRGPYRLLARAESMAATRRRITQAAIDLHGSIGPQATTMSAVAARAGVTRATLYRHFATEAALFAACSRDWLAANPRPDLAAWSSIVDPAERVRHVLAELYGYYRSTERMLANLYRDLPSLPAEIAANLAAYPGQMAAVLDRDWPPASTSAARLRHGAILHAVTFETWGSLARAGLSDEEASALMVALVIAAASGAAAASSRHDDVSARDAGPRRDAG
jgi:AcrR family transcriptional regulator